MQFGLLTAALIALATITACMTIHVVFMFFTLRLQVAFQERFTRARGIGLLVPTILMAVGLMTISGHIQVAIWAGVLWQCANFDSVNDALYFSATSSTTLAPAGTSSARRSGCSSPRRRPTECWRPDSTRPSSSP